MINNIIPAIKKIFVGRHSEIQQLNDLWNHSSLSGEHYVYVFLNAPGVGKTTLIEYFGKYLESNTKGLYVRFVCDTTYDSNLKINKALLNAINKAIINNTQVIEKYLNSKIENHTKEKKNETIELIKKEISENLKNNEIDLYDIFTILDKFSEIMPIFLAADEIQEFQKINLKDVKDTSKEESALHYYTRVLKSLLNSKILLVLSGTRYHILSQIGDSIGSPIRQKVKSIIIRNFDQNELNDYTEQVKNILDNQKYKKDEERVLILLKNYHQFLLAFSGGHPRTIENITELFLNYFPAFYANDKFQDYKEFLEYFLPKIEEIFSNSILSTVHKEVISQLSSSEAFSNR